LKANNSVYYNIAKGRGHKAEGKRLTGKDFSILLCPNPFGNCYIKFGRIVTLSLQQDNLDKKFRHLPPIQSN